MTTNSLDIDRIDMAETDEEAKMLEERRNYILSGPDEDHMKVYELLRLGIGIEEISRFLSPDAIKTGVGLTVLIRELATVGLPILRQLVDSRLKDDNGQSNSLREPIFSLLILDGIRDAFLRSQDLQKKENTIELKPPDAV